MKCYICRTKLGDGDTGLALGLGDETKENGGFLLCKKCTHVLVKTWMLIHDTVEQFRPK